jgi:hypothetical protein
MGEVKYVARKLREKKDHVEIDIEKIKQQLCVEAKRVHSRL